MLLQGLCADGTTLRPQPDIQHGRYANGIPKHFLAVDVRVSAFGQLASKVPVFGGLGDMCVLERRTEIERGSHHSMSHNPELVLQDHNNPQSRPKAIQTEYSEAAWLNKNEPTNSTCMVACISIYTHTHARVPLYIFCTA